MRCTAITGALKIKLCKMMNGSAGYGANKETIFNFIYN
jgi:hypothetical protein